MSKMKMDQDVPVTEKVTNVPKNETTPKVSATPPPVESEPLTRSAPQQVLEISALLQQGRQRIGFLLGAGCPMSVRPNGVPLIPGIAGLTEVVKAHLVDKCALEWGKLKEVMTADKLTDTVEGMLTEVRQLSSVCGQCDVRGLSAKQLGSLEREICRAVHNVMTKSLPSRTTPYHDFAWWAGSCERDFPIEVFTTNYDLLVEQALEESGVPYFDGFVGARQAFFNAGAMTENVLPTWLRLWKLHGSVNWQRTDKGVIRTDSTAFDEEKSLVIHPSHLKYDQSRKMPYLALMDQFRRFLLTPRSILVVCGYSFGDQHLNDAIADALLSNKTATVFALVMEGVHSCSPAIAEARRVRNLEVLANDGGVLGSRDFVWGKPLGSENQPGQNPESFTAGNFAVLAAEMRRMSPSEMTDAANA